MNGAVMNMDGTLCIYCQNEVLVGVTQYRLLNQIVVDGSINVAARNLSMSYQYAWNLINRMNHLAPMPLVVRRKGRKDGGCFVSAYGMKILSTYAQREFELMEFLRVSNRLLHDCLWD